MAFGGKVKGWEARRLEGPAYSDGITAFLESLSRSNWPIRRPAAGLNTETRLRGQSLSGAAKAGNLETLSLSKEG